MSTDVSEEHVASIFKIQARQHKGVKHLITTASIRFVLLFDDEDGRDMLLRNVG
jgi:hypothetical protein